MSKSGKPKARLRVTSSTAVDMSMIMPKSTRYINKENSFFIFSSWFITKKIKSRSNLKALKIPSGTLDLCRITSRNWTPEFDSIGV